MKSVELYAQVRYAVQIEGVSRREAARRYGIDPRTVAKMLAFSVPPGYRRSRPPARPKLDPFTRMIDAIDRRCSRCRRRTNNPRRRQSPKDGRWCKIIASGLGSATVECIGP